MQDPQNVTGILLDRHSRIKLINISDSCRTRHSLFNFTDSKQVKLLFTSLAHYHRLYHEEDYRPRQEHICIQDTFSTKQSD